MNLLQRIALRFTVTKQLRRKPEISSGSKGVHTVALAIPFRECQFLG